MQVNILRTPSCDELRLALDSLQPSLVYFKGAKHEDGNEVGSLVMGNAEISMPEDISALFGPKLPTAVSYSLYL